MEKVISSENVNKYGRKTTKYNGILIMNIMH